MGDENRKIKLAAVQAASVFLDRDGGIEKTCALIREAGAAGADIIGFPEGFIPGHPHWFHFLPLSSAKAMGLSRELFKNSVEVPGSATEAISAACREANIVAVVGICERRPNTTGSMWNTQIFFDRDGKYLGKHQKIMPTLGERIVHTGGFGDTLRAYPTDLGNVSGLICGENSNPLAVYTMAAMHPTVHVASWPAYFGQKIQMIEAISVAGRSLASQMGCFVINSTGTVTDDMIDAYAVTDEDREFLAAVNTMGSAAIMGPGLYEKPTPGEGILYAETEMDKLFQSGVSKDYAGHYNRFDIFSLSVNAKAPPIITRDGERAGSDDAVQEPAEVLDFDEAGRQSMRK